MIEDRKVGLPTASLLKAVLREGQNIQSGSTHPLLAEQSLRKLDFGIHNVRHISPSCQTLTIKSISACLLYRVCGHNNTFKRLTWGFTCLSFSLCIVSWTRAPGSSRDLRTQGKQVNRRQVKLITVVKGTTTDRMWQKTQSAQEIYKYISESDKP